MENNCKELYEAGIQMLNNGDRRSAEEVFIRLKREFPNLYFGHWGLLVLKTNYLSDYEEIGKQSSQNIVDRYIHSDMGSDDLKRAVEEMGKRQRDVTYSQELRTLLNNAYSFSPEDMRKKIEEYKTRCEEACSKYVKNAAEGSKGRYYALLEEERYRSNLQSELLKKQDGKKKIGIIAVIVAVIGLIILIMFGGMVPEEAPISEDFYVIDLGVTIISIIVAVKCLKGGK